MSDINYKPSEELLNYSVRDLFSPANFNQKAKTWLVEKLDEEGNHVILSPIHNLSSFCKERNLNYDKLRNGDRVGGYFIIKRL